MEKSASDNQSRRYLVGMRTSSVPRQFVFFFRLDRPFYISGPREKAKSDKKENTYEIHMWCLLSYAMTRVGESV